MKHAFALTLILGFATSAQAQNTLSERVTLAHGSYSSGGGITIAAELRPKDGRLSLIHISEPTRQYCQSRMPSSA